MKTISILRLSNSKPLASQLIIKDDDLVCEYTYFQSYKSIIVKKTVSKAKKCVISMRLDNNWDMASTTTIKYLKIFLGVGSKKEIKNNIKSGEYSLTCLN